MLPALVVRTAVGAAATLVLVPVVIGLPQPAEQANRQNPPAAPPPFRSPRRGRR